MPIIQRSKKTWPALERYRDSSVRKAAVEYLVTGESDPLAVGFGGDVVESLNRHDRHLREALLGEVERRALDGHHWPLPTGFDPILFTRLKVEPMIRGLFPAAEREVVLGVAERSIVFLTPEAIHQAIREVPFLETAWTLARIYLDSLRVPILGAERNAAVGLNEETTCYVSLDYFRQNDPFADYVLHEVAHIFHNCKRERLGLPRTRSKEWLLDISYKKRELFAYACEVYGRIVQRANGTAQRRADLTQYAQTMAVGDDRVDRAELIDVLAEAIEARNGWKCILIRCSPPKVR